MAGPPMGSKDGQLYDSGWTPEKNCHKGRRFILGLFDYIINL